MRDAGRSERSIEIALATIRRAFNKAKDWGVFEGENPVSKVKIPRKDNRRLRFLTPEEAKALFWRRYVTAANKSMKYAF